MNIKKLTATCNQFFSTTYEKGDSMDNRLLEIVDKCKEKFGLSEYQLHTHSIHKERNNKGKAYYKFNMEFIPNISSEKIEEDVNPEGTVVIDYNIQSKIVENVIYVNGKSYSTKTHFPDRTIEEIALWVEEETGLTYQTDFKLSEKLNNGFQFKSDVDGINITPTGMIEVEFDELGKLTAYHLFDTIPSSEEITKSSFTLTLEEIEPLVKEQLQLVEFPNESEKRFSPVYAIEEVYIPMDASRLISFFEHERSKVKIDEKIEWEVPVIVELNREEISFVSDATIEEAFNNIDVEEKLFVTDKQIEQSKIIVRDVLRTVLPKDSGLWQLDTIDRHENFIEAVCKMNESDSSFFNRKFVVLINPETMALINYLDNGQMFEIFDTFAPAEKSLITHEEAFEKLLSYISLEPGYVYDEVTNKYILCGLLDASEGIDAVTGEVVSLSEF